MLEAIPTSVLLSKQKVFICEQSVFICEQKTVFWVIEKIDFLDENAFKLIGLLVQKPLYLREIAEKAGVSTSTVFKVMKKLGEQGMVKSESSKNKRVFRLNRESPFTKQAIALILSHQIVKSKAFKAIKAGSQKVILFGSAANGGVDALSDLDIAVIARKGISREKLFTAKSLLEKETGREVQLLCLTKEKMQELGKENRELFNELVYGGILLWGEKR